MPLVPQYTWEEDASSLALELHVPGTALRNTDIYGRNEASAPVKTCSVRFTRRVCVVLVTSERPGD